MASGAESYIDIETTKLPVRLIHTPMYGQCMTSAVGSYIRTKITKCPMVLAGALV
jgi:hypothetical protein